MDVIRWAPVAYVAVLAVLVALPPVRAWLASGAELRAHRAGTWDELLVAVFRGLGTQATITAAALRLFGEQFDREMAAMVRAEEERARLAVAYRRRRLPK